MTLIHADSFDYFANLNNNGIAKPDVIFLDPMYPLRDKVALPKKSMMIAR
jgi:16S rRNA (guanine1516-N2)-methyltransferase